MPNEFDRMPNNFNDNERKTHDKGNPGVIRGRKVTGSLDAQGSTERLEKPFGKNLRKSPGKDSLTAGDVFSKHFCSRAFLFCRKIVLTRNTKKGLLDYERYSPDASRKGGGDFMRNRSILLLAGLLAAMLAMWFIDSSYLASEDSTNRTEQNRTQTPYIALT